jgi:integrase
LRPGKKGRKLPQVLITDEFRRFYQEVDRTVNAQHGLMLWLLFYTAVRVSRLVNMKAADVDLEANKVRIDGKGSKDRYVLIRYFCRAFSCFSHGPKYTSLPRIFLAQRPTACGKSGKSGDGLVGLTRRPATAASHVSSTLRRCSNWCNVI